MAIARMLPTNLFFIPEYASLYVDSKLAYIGLILNADDEGRGYADPHTIARIIDSWDSQVKTSLRQLHDTGLILLYEVGKQYYQIKNWSNMQQGMRFKHPSSLPPPPVSEHTESNSTRPANTNENHSADVVVVVVEKESNNNNKSASETEKVSTEPEPETTIATDTENQNHQTTTPEQTIASTKQTIASTEQTVTSTPPSRSSRSEGSEENITTTTSGETEKAQTRLRDAIGAQRNGSRHSGTLVPKNECASRRCSNLVFN